MTINLECYRYAMPGTRQRTGTHQQQLRYLAGLEIRTDISHQHLQSHNLAPIYRCDIEGCPAFFILKPNSPCTKKHTKKWM